MDNKDFYIEARKNGKSAEGRIAGALRGGYVYKGYFTANGPVGSHHIKSVKETDELTVYEIDLDSPNSIYSKAQA